MVRPGIRAGFDQVDSLTGELGIVRRVVEGRVEHDADSRAVGICHERLKFTQRAAARIIRSH